MPVLGTVASLVDSLNVGPLQVERRGPPTANAYGGFDAATPAVLFVSPIAAHNLDGRDLLQLPEAERTSETVEFYTRQRLFSTEDGQDADVVLYNGRRFRIIRTKNYDLQGGVFVSIGQLEDLQARP